VTSSWASDYPNLCDWMTDLLRQSPTRTIHIHVLQNTITANPDNIEHMLKKNFQNYPKGKPFSAILGDLLGDGIFNADGECWHFQRMMAAVELNAASVRDFTAHIVSLEIKHRLLPLLESMASNNYSELPDREVIDLQDVFRRFAFDVMCKVSFGLDPGCLQLSLPVSEFAKAFDTASMLSARRGAAAFPFIWKAKRLLNIGSERELKQAIQMVNCLANEVIRQRRKIGFSSTNDLLSRFMGSVQDDTYLRDIVINFMLAGRDTVASSLTFFFLQLSKQSHVKFTIREELERIGSCDKVGNMQYLQAALYESMRLYPPVQFDSKFCLENDILPDGTFVSKGTRVTYHSYAMGRMEELWDKDWAEFRPERWIRDDGKFSFLPESAFKCPIFHAGPRECIGKKMAMMEMKAVVAAVVKIFDIEVLNGDSPKFSPGLTACLTGGLLVRVHPRDKHK
jgi:12-hydroxyjasmonoyl-L-amino acid 12-hydroxylase / fatty acid hydroxylase